MSQPLWLPTMHTPSLTGTEDFVTDGDWLIRFVEKYVRLEGSKTAIVLDDYQKWLLRHWLERYPDDHPKYPGQLRFQEVCTSLARQNGKSVLGLCMVVYYLLKHDARVISLASKKTQADIIYNKVVYAINNEPGFLRRFKPTGTRGINVRDKKKSGSYTVFAGNGDTLQGEAAGLVAFDELHISKMEAYDAMLDGISAQKDAMILGITTAGDENSHLLKRLYVAGKAAVNKEENYNERFGFFLWEAPADLDLFDPQAILAANPSLASGASRIDIDAEIAKMRSKPEHWSKRYRLNQFVAAENPWLSIDTWNKRAGQGIPKDKKHPVVFAVERSLNWEYASIVAAVKVDGKVYTEVIKTYEYPNIEWLEKDCLELRRVWNPEGFYMDVGVLRELSVRLREKNVQVEYLTAGQLANATETAFSLIMEDRVEHANDPIVRSQLPKTVSETSREGGQKVSRRKSSGHVDSVVATVIAIWAAENMKERPASMFFFSKKTD